jgi:hypothetical protein
MKPDIGWPRIAALLLLGGVATAGLGAQRAFVSGEGDDASAAAGCPVAAPCRTLTAAVAVADTGGEVIVLDPGPYTGPVAITRSLTVTTARGLDAAVDVPATQTGFYVNAPGATVLLRGFSIASDGADHAIAVNAVGSLTLERIEARGAVFTAVLIAGSTSSIAIVDSVIVRTGNYGMAIEGYDQKAASMLLALDRVAFVDLNGAVTAGASLRLGPSVTALARGVTMTGTAGLWLDPAGGGPVAASITDSLFTGPGVVVAGDGARVDVARSTFEGGAGVGAGFTFGVEPTVAVVDSSFAGTFRGLTVSSDGPAGGQLLSVRNQFHRLDDAAIHAEGAGTRATIVRNRILGVPSGLVGTAGAILATTGDTVIEATGTPVAGAVVPAPKW